jgi:hypothetical protein
MTEQKEFVDFNVGLGDSGEDNLSAIQPNSDGEGATQVVLRRPSENLRERTETLRDVVGELLYYRDYSHLMIEYTGGTITWEGAAPGAPPLGRITVTAGNFTVAPMLAPYQAKKGTLSVGTPASNQVIYTVAASSYATHGMNAVTIKHLHSASAVSVSVTISGGPVKRIVVTLNTSDITHTATAVQTALAIAIAADTALAGRLTITTSAVPGVAAIALAETRLDTTADDEKHVIAGSDIQTLTTTTPLQPGMGVAIWYKYVIEPTGFGGDPKGGLAGGRAESSGDRGTSAIPAAALFVTHVSPDKIPGAIPLCRVGYNGQLIWYDGTRLETGESFQFKSPTSVAALALSSFTTTLAGVTGGALVGYNGSGFWADGTTAVTSATVEAAIDEIVADLAALTATSPGAIRVGVDAPTIFGTALTALGGGGALTTNTTTRAALAQLHTSAIARRGFTAVCTDGVASVGGDFNAPALFASVNTLGAGRYFVRRGAYTTAVDLTTVYGAAFIGEAQGLVTLAASTSVKLVASDAAAVHEFENVYFTVSSASVKYNLSKRSLSLKNCRAQAGVLAFDYVAPAVATRFSVDNLLINTDNSIDANAAVYISNNSTDTAPITGEVTNLQIRRVNSLNSASVAKYGLQIQSLGNAGFNTDDVLTFKNCVIDPSAGFGLGNGAVLRIQQSYQPLLFKDCLFRCSQASVAPYVLDIADSIGITFDNCKFVQDSGGPLLKITGTSSDITFTNCKFYSSITDVYEDEFNATCEEIATTTPAKPISFINCYIEIRKGTNTPLPRITLNRTAAADTGTGPIAIDGLQIVLNYTSSAYMNNDFMWITTGLSPTVLNAGSIRDLSIDFRQRRLVQANARALLLKGSASTRLRVTNLVLEGVAEPHDSVATNNTCRLVAMYNASVIGGSVRGTPQGSNVAYWKAIFDLNNTGDSVSDVIFWENDTPNKGRLFYLNTLNCRVTRNTVRVTNLASGEEADGWFCYAEQRRATISDNDITITTGVGSLSAANDADALINIAATADLCLVSKNIIFIPTTLHAIVVSGSGAMVVGNVLVHDIAGTNSIIRVLVASSNSNVSANMLFNLTGTASLSNAGGATVNGDNVAV